MKMNVSACHIQQVHQRLGPITHGVTIKCDKRSKNVSINNIDDTLLSPILDLIVLVIMALILCF